MLLADLGDQSGAILEFAGPCEVADVAQARGVTASNDHTARFWDARTSKPRPRPLSIASGSLRRRSAPTARVSSP
jgi:hypothetical protein